MQTTTAEAELVRATAERDALARHIEKLIAPVTDVEARTAQIGFESGWSAMQDVLTAFLAERQREGQFAALSPPLPL